MSKSTNSDSGDPEEFGRGDAASGPPDQEQGDTGASDQAESSAAEEQADAEAGTEGEATTTGEADTRSRSEQVAAAVAAQSAARRDGRDRPSSVRASEVGKGRATASRAEAEATRVPKRNFFVRLVQFVRQVIAELRKVVTPTRNELVTYATVVVVFLAIMMAFISALDFGVGRLVLWAFGG